MGLQPATDFPLPQFPETLCPRTQTFLPGLRLAAQHQRSHKSSKDAARPAPSGMVESIDPQVGRTVPETGPLARRVDAAALDQPVEFALQQPVEGAPLAGRQGRSELPLDAQVRRASRDHDIVRPHVSLIPRCPGQHQRIQAQIEQFGKPTAAHKAVVGQAGQGREIAHRRLVARKER